MQILRDAKGSRANSVEDTRLCQWTGPYSDLKKHIERCPFNLSTCSYGCKRLLMKQDNYVHEQQCPFFPVKCNLCLTVMGRHLLDRHRAVDCPYGTVECQYCHEVMKNKDSWDHLNKDCQEVTVDCPFKGCYRMMKRRIYPSIFKMNK